MAILVTGGAGYIGSHTLVELSKEGYDLVVVDNLSNASPLALKRVEQIIGKKIPFYQVDCLDQAGLSQVFEQEKIDAVIHFAALKAVGESVAQPLRYYENNVSGTLSLCQVMQKYGCKNIVFSSSATVYGEPKVVPITEEAEKGELTNPYGRTKAMMEQILQDLQNADSSWNVCLLRYFNPIGAHASGLIGEDPKGIPNNLLPYITQVAVGKLKELTVFGNDYDTHDGTCIRDYVHVVDLAIGHVKALNKILNDKPALRIYNLGTGKGHTVLEVIHAFEKANQLKVPYVIKGRRAGDVPATYADTKKAFVELGFQAEKTLEEMCQDAFRFQQNHPQGYQD